jgi:hypothetical protein
MNDCCRHLFREAKKELEIRDKRITELQAECTRLFEPVREFWNVERISEVEKLKEELNLTNQILWEITDKWKDTSDWEKAIYDTIFFRHKEYLRKFIEEFR